MTNKPIAYYGQIVSPLPVMVGAPVIFNRVYGHPNEERVTGKGFVITSPVVRIWDRSEKGLRMGIETENTMYLPSEHTYD